MKVAETPRLALRTFALQDVEFVHGLVYGDPEVAVPWIGRVLSLDEVRGPRGFLSRIARDNDEPGLLAIDRLADHVMVGVAGIIPLRRAEDRERFEPPSESDRLGMVPGRLEAELSIALGRSFWNRGYAVEAAQAVIAHAFGTLRFSRVVASVGPRNERGLALLKRLGFRLVANSKADPQFGTASPGMIGFLDAPRRG